MKKLTEGKGKKEYVNNIHLLLQENMFLFPYENGKNGRNYEWSYWQWDFLKFLYLQQSWRGFKIHIQGIQLYWFYRKMIVKCINGSVDEFRPLQIVFQPAYEIQMTPFLNTSIISLTRDSTILQSLKKISNRNPNLSPSEQTVVIHLSSISRASMPTMAT